MEWVTYTFIIDKRISMAVVGWIYSINKPTSFLLKKNKDEIMGSIKASIQQSIKMYQVSPCDPFLKKIARVLWVRT
jgi:predicted DNA-binding transcriptional regulator